MKTFLFSVVVLVVMVIIIVCMCVCVHVCVPVHSTYMTGAHRGQKRASDALELEIKTVVNYQVNARNQSESSERAVSALDS